MTTMKMEMEINLLEEKKARAIAKALEGGKHKRSKVELGTKGTCLAVCVKAEDAVALRSAVNSYLRLIDACLKITE